MVGPFPGPFDRTHYSDSSSENQTDPQQSRPPKAQAPAPRQPGPHLGMLLEQEPSRTPGAPHDGVAYSAVMQTDSGAPSPAPTYQEPLPESPPEPPRPRRAASLAKSKCYALLCRLAVAALGLAAVAILVGAVSRGVRGGVNTDTAPVKAGNVAVKAANATGRKNTACPCSASSTTHATPAAVKGPNGHGTVPPPGATRHHKRRGGTGHGLRAGQSSSSSTSSSPSSSWLPTTTEDAWPTTQAADRGVPPEPALRDVGDLTPSGQRTVPTTSGPTRTSEGAAATAATSTSQTATVEASGEAVGLAGEATGRIKRGRPSSLGPTPAASPRATASPGSPPGAMIAQDGSVPVATTTASTDLPEVINEADARTDLQEV